VQREAEIILKVVTKRERPKIPANIDPRLKDLKPLLKRCWHNDPRERPTATEIHDIIQLDPSEWKKQAEGYFTPTFKKLFLSSLWPTPLP
jgi:hypothetical protein